MIYSVTNHKGGVGKTTSVVNLGAGLARAGKRVLLIDLDPQANLSQSLGIDGQSPTTYDYLRGQAMGSTPPVKPTQVTKNLEAIPSTLDLSGAEIELSSETGREYILKQLLEPIRGGYDYILIDTPPSLGLLTINALTASQGVLIPLQAQYLALQGLTKLMEVIDKIQTRINLELQVGGIFVTQYDRRKILHREVLSTIGGHYGNKVFSTQIRDNIALAEAPTSGMDIFRYAPKSYGATDYKNLSKELLSATFEQNTPKQ